MKTGALGVLLTTPEKGKTVLLNLCQQLTHYLVNVYTICEKQQYLAVCESEKKDKIELYDLAMKGKNIESFSTPCNIFLRIYKLNN